MASAIVWHETYALHLSALWWWLAGSTIKAELS